MKYSHDPFITSTSGGPGSPMRYSLEPLSTCAACGSLSLCLHFQHVCPESMSPDSGGVYLCLTCMGDAVYFLGQCIKDNLADGIVAERLLEGLDQNGRFTGVAHHTGDEPGRSYTGDGGSGHYTGDEDGCATGEDDR